MSQLVELIADLFSMRGEEITDELTMKDIDVWDSLKHMELVVSIQETYDVELGFDDIVAMQNVKEIKRILTEKGVEI